MGMLFRRKLVFGPREVLLTSDQPVVKQFLNGRRIGPIGMSEEKGDAQMAQEHAMVEAGQNDGGVGEIHGVPPQIQPTPGLPDRKAVHAVDETTVMGGDDHATGELADRVLQRRKGFGVQVVGRLVEQRHVTALLQRECEVEPVAFPRPTTGAPVCAGRRP